MLGFCCLMSLSKFFIDSPRGHRSRDRMVVGMTTTYAISAYNRQRASSNDTFFNKS
jgi:hypothetical protein